MNLNQVTVPTRNMKKSAEFYTLLGLELIVNSIPRYCRFICPDGASTLSLHEAEVVNAKNGITLYFECHDLDDKVISLQNAGLNFLSKPTDQAWLWREASILDPDGHKIILFFAGDNRLNPPWKVKK
jgi:catechol 2,3-dioxygenase-like lactoylglutathione lyase family enzyme